MNTTLEKLESLVEGLLYSGESESTFSVQYGEFNGYNAFKELEVLEGEGHMSMTKVSFSTHFIPMSTVYDWMNEDESYLASKYRKLIEYINSTMKESTVYTYTVDRVHYTTVVQLHDEVSKGYLLISKSVMT